MEDNIRALQTSGGCQEQLADLRRRSEEAIWGKGRCWWNPEPPPR